jgi:hypothetical protein
VRRKQWVGTGGGRLVLVRSARGRRGRGRQNSPMGCVPVWPPRRLGTEPGALGHGGSEYTSRGEAWGFCESFSEKASSTKTITDLFLSVVINKQRGVLLSHFHRKALHMVIQTCSP